MKIMTGEVVSNKMNKTVVVSVERSWRHPIYKKIVKSSKKYLAHNEQKIEVGDKVTIKETRPLSKNKRWTIVEKIEKDSKKKNKKSK